MEKNVNWCSSTEYWLNLQIFSINTETFTEEGEMKLE